MQEENVTIITTADGQQIGLREEDREQLGINVRTNLATYCQRTSEPQAPYIVKEMHQLILDNLMMVFAGKIKKLIIQCPPRLGKSEAVCQKFPSWCMGLDPTLKFIVAGYGQDLPNSFCRKTQEYINSESYQCFFDTKLKTQQANYFNTPQGGYYKATSIGGPLTGFGYDIGIIDDPVKNREEANSPTYRQNVISRYDSVFNTRQMSSNSAQIIVMTRRHTDDLVGILLERERQMVKEGSLPPNYEPRTVISIEALQPNPDRDNYSEHGPRGKYLSFRPERFTVEDLLEKKKTAPLEFAALYMQDPIGAMGSIFNPQNYLPFLESDFEGDKPRFLKEDVELGIFVDPAMSTDPTSSDTSIFVLGRHRITKHLFIFDMRANTDSPTVSIDYIFMIAERWRMRGFYIAMISIEEVHLNKGMAAFIELFRKQQTIRGTNYLLHLYHPEGKKIDRIRYNLEPAINNREVYFIQNTYSTDFEKLYRQLQQFPNSDKLDVIDVFAQGVDVWRHRGDLQNPNQKAKKTREAIYNPLTGRFE